MNRIIFNSFPRYYFAYLESLQKCLKGILDTILMHEKLHNLIKKSDLLEKRREKRLNFALKRVEYSGDSVILDVGCGKTGRSLECFLQNNSIVGIDLYDPNQIDIDHPDFTYYQGDAEDMSIFDDDEFDISLCIGMLEHICDRKKLENICSEIRRVSKQSVVLVPYRYTPIEQHFKLPFFAVYPYGLKLSLTKTFNLHGLRESVRDDPEYIKENYQWLTKQEWKKYFPKSKMYVYLFDSLIIISKD